MYKRQEVNRTKKGVDCTVKVMLLCEIAVVICNEEDRPKDGRIFLFYN